MTERVPAAATTGSTPPPVCKYLTTEELATEVRTTPDTVRYWHHVGIGPKSFKVGRRRLYAREDVDEFIATARAAGDAR